MKEKDLQIAHRFLKTGDLAGNDSELMAGLCNRLIRKTTEISSSKSIKLGKSFVKHAEAIKGSMRITAYRALGWALLIGGKFSEAEQSYLKARKLAKNDPATRGNIDIILIDIYMYLNNFRESNRRAKMAFRTFKKLKATEELYRARVNYANTLHRQDRHDEALKLYSEARQYYFGRDNEIYAAFCLYNEANTLVQLFEFKAAEEKYRLAEKIFNKESYHLRANGCRYGLAWLHMLQGDYHLALKELSDCENEYLKASQRREIILCQLDRAEAYLGLNLYSEARLISLKAEKDAIRLGINYESAKAALFLAKASMAIGKMHEAKSAIRRAEKKFAEERNYAFWGAAELTSIVFENNTQKRLDKINAARGKFAKTQLPLWEAICDLQILSEFPDDKVVLDRLSGNPAVRTVPHLFARWRTMEGDRFARQGDMKTASKNWREACMALDKVRTKLPAIDIQAKVLKGNDDPYYNLIASEIDVDPVSAAAWAEKFKTAGLWQIDISALNKSPYRIKAEQSLTQLAYQVTAFSTVLDRESKKHRSPVAKASGIPDMETEEQIRCDLLHLMSSSKIKSRNIEQIRDDIGQTASELPVVQLHSDRNDLIAFIHNGSQTKVHRFINGNGTIQNLMGQWRFLVEKATYKSPRINKTEIDEETRFLKVIGDWLIAPLEIPQKAGKILILPSGPLTNLPWQAIIHNGNNLVDKYEIILAPSLQHYVGAKAIKTNSNKINIYIGNVDNLEISNREYASLIRSKKFNVSLYQQANRNDWCGDQELFLAHFIGHADFNSSNPFYSSLLMNDGPFYAADFRIRKCKTNLVTLAACRTGQQISIPGEETSGLVRSLLEMGARNVIAGQWAVHNKTTTDWMEIFYDQLLGGSELPKAVKTTTEIIKTKYLSAYHWGSFVLYGAG